MNSFTTGSLSELNKVGLRVSTTIEKTRDFLEKTDLSFYDTLVHTQLHHRFLIETSLSFGVDTHFRPDRKSKSPKDVNTIFKDSL